MKQAQTVNQPYGGHDNGSISPAIGTDESDPDSETNLPHRQQVAWLMNQNCNNNNNNNINHNKVSFSQAFSFGSASSRRQVTGLSTFSASDCERAIILHTSPSISQPTGSDIQQSANESQHPKAALGRANPGNPGKPVTLSFGGSGQHKFANSKFRVHMRHRSIGRFSEFVASPSVSVANLAPIEQQVPTIGRREQRNIAKQQLDNNNSSATNNNPSNPQEHEQQLRLSSSQTSINHNNMSQTMQSIHSLSLQLNRASSQGELCQISSAPQSPMPIRGVPMGGMDSLGDDKAGGGPSKKLSKLLGKKASRVKEILLQNIGKAERTNDEMFKIYEENFYKQQTQAIKLHKEFKSYLAALKGSQDSSKSLNVCIQQSTSDYQSARHDLVCENLSQMEHLNDDLMEKLRGQIFVSFNEYLTQFNELREKISKRRRKLIDYDSSRRVYEIMLATVNKKRIQMQQAQVQVQQNPPGESVRSFRSTFMLSRSGSTGSGTIQSATSQLVDEARLLKLREQYNYCKIMYETINSELREELTIVYEKKMKHLLMTLQNYFSLEAQFHSNAGKLYSTAGDVIDELPMSMHAHNQISTSVGGQDGAGDDFKTASGSSGVGSSRGDTSAESSSPDSSSNGSPVQGEDTEADHEPPENKSGDEVVDNKETEATQSERAPEEAISVEEEESSECNSGKDSEAATRAETPIVDCSIGQADVVDVQDCLVSDDCSVNSVIANHAGCVSVITEASTKIAAQSSAEGAGNVTSVEDARSSGNTPIVLSGCGVEAEESKLLYKVKTCYKYLAEDVDELCFEADEVIQVVTFEPNQEQEEGWLMGVRESNGQRGLFPANFTQPL